MRHVPVLVQALGRFADRLWRNMNKNVKEARARRLEARVRLLRGHQKTYPHRAAGIEKAIEGLERQIRRLRDEADEDGHRRTS